MKSKFVKLTRFSENRYVYIKREDIFKIEDYVTNDTCGSTITYCYNKSADCISVRETPEEVISLIECVDDLLV